MRADLKPLLTEAAEWRLLAMLFEYPAGEWRRQVEVLAAEITQTNLRNAAQGAVQDATEGLHLAFFGPGAPVSLREATYLGGVQLGYLMSELSAQYEAFGYEAASAESQDHLSVELGFLSYLKLKQAYATACGDGDHAAIAEEAAVAFVKDHLSLIAEPVANALESLAPDYLVHAGRFLLDRIGPRPRSSYPLGGDVIDRLEGDEMRCGDGETSAGLVQLNS
jgi:nitrate reductase assembly molybdenum cofactor insertion protein NarJ